MKSNVSHVVYRQLLCQNGHGYPLWTPEPDQSLPFAFQQRGITVGDVGILTERGGFDFLFNIHEAANGSVNESQVPLGFEPLSLGARDVSVHPHIHNERSSIISSSVSRRSIMFDAEAELGFVAGGGFGFEFSTESDQAAVLVLPHGATGYDAKYRGCYEEYAKKNAKAWYAYANGILGCGAANGTLYLVTGCDKARSWGTAAVSRSSQTRSASLKFIAGGFGGSTVSFQSSWSHDFDVETRNYPPSSGSPSLDEVHCVFTRGFTIAIRQNVFGRAIKGSVQVSSTTPSALPKAPQSYWPPLGSRDAVGARPAQHTSTLQDTLPSTSAAPSIPEHLEYMAMGSADQHDIIPSLEWREGSDSDMEVVVESFYANSNDQLCNPSSIICTSILKHHEDVDIAIVHDDDWASIFRDVPGGPDHSTWIQFLDDTVDDPEIISHNSLAKDDLGCAVLLSSWYTSIPTFTGSGQIRSEYLHDSLSRTLSTDLVESEIPYHHRHPRSPLPSHLQHYAKPSHNYKETSSPPSAFGRLSEPTVSSTTTPMTSLTSSPDSPVSPYHLITSPTQKRSPHKPARQKTPHKRKHANETTRDITALSDNDDDDDGGGIQIGGLGGPSARTNGGKARPPGACTHCKKLKMKCDFSPGDTTNTCKRCKSGGHVCIVEGRKPRTAPNKREYLLAQIRQKDTIIESLLKQLHNPYLATPLSIASYKNAVNGAATGSSGDVSVGQWLDKLNSPTLSTTFNQVRNGNGMDDESASDEDDDEREGDDNEDDEDDDGERDREASAALPDSHVPLGLIANLSLTTQRGKRSRRGRGRGGANPPQLNAAATMIGPTTTFYDPYSGQLRHNDGGQSYHQWAEAYRHDSTHLQQRQHHQQSYYAQPAYYYGNANDSASDYQYYQQHQQPAQILQHYPSNSTVSPTSVSSSTSPTTYFPPPHSVSPPNPPQPTQKRSPHNPAQQKTPSKRKRSDSDDEDDEDGERDREASAALPDSHVPLGLIANFSLTTQRGKRSRQGRGRGGANLASSTGTAKQGTSTNGKTPDEEGIDDENVGVANEGYFMPGPATSLDKRAMLIEQHSPPEILVHGLVAPSDVDELFKIYYRDVDPFISLLDPVLHTPQTTFTRCPFLFTVICAISSRYHPVKSSIYPIAMHFAKHSAANALIDGWKSVELCQAYILMSIHAVPARRWEEDRSWLYTGLAIRIATDLNLHLASSAPPPKGKRTEEYEREQLNRDRVWQICFNLDRSTATQFGKPTTIREDAVIRDCVTWYKRSKYNIGYDVHLCGYTVLLRIVARFHDEVWATAGGQSGRMNMKKLDFRKITLPYDRELDVYQDTWDANFKEVGGDAGAQMRCKLLPFLVAYSRLVMFSFGFQQAYSRGIREEDDLFFKKCLESAKTVVRCMVLELIPTGFMRFAPDGHFIFSAFASAFLLKLMRPEFMSSGKSQPSPSLLTKADEEEIFSLIGNLIQKLSGSSVSIDERHTPRLYARFLAGLLGKCKREAAGPTVGVTRLDYPQQYSQQPYPASSTSSGYQYPQQQQTYQTGPPVHFGAGEMDMEYTFEYQTHGAGFTDGAAAPSAPQPAEPGVLAALKNPAWWETMMMPGFQWMEASSPGSTSSGDVPAPTPPQQEYGYPQMGMRQ